jgi:methionyl-tRNA formyltransferase
MALKRILILANGTGGETALNGLLPFHLKTVDIVAAYPWAYHPKGRHEYFMAEFNAPFIALAKQHNIPLLADMTCNSPAFIDWLIAQRIDSILIMAWGAILKAPVLDLPITVVNMHPSLLPKYKGFNPIAAAIDAGDTETGVTFHQVVDTGIDTGPIILQHPVPIYAADTGGTLLGRCESTAQALLPQVVDWLIQPYPTRPQPVGGSYVKAPQQTDACINWALPPDAICRRARALQPWFLPYTFLHAIPVMCQRLTMLSKPYNPESGQIIRAGQLVSVTSDALTLQSSDPNVWLSLQQYQLGKHGQWLSFEDSVVEAFQQLTIDSFMAV